MPLEKVITYVSAALAHTLQKPRGCGASDIAEYGDIHRVTDTARNALRTERARTCGNG